MNNSKIITDVVNANTSTLCTNIMDVLHKHYPGHRWMVGIDDVGGIVNICHPELSGVHGMTLHITKIDSNFKKVVRAGGELLERFRIARGCYNADAMAELKRNNLRGEATFDV